MSYSPFVDELLDLMTQQVQLAPFSGRTTQGDPSYGTTRTYWCHSTASNKAFYSGAGEVIYSSAVTQMHPKATDTTVLTTLGAEPANARLTLADGTTPRILSIAPVYDEIGLCYWEIYT